MQLKVSITEVVFILNTNVNNCEDANCINSWSKKYFISILNKIVTNY